MNTFYYCTNQIGHDVNNNFDSIHYHYKQSSGVYPNIQTKFNPNSIKECICANQKVIGLAIVKVPQTFNRYTYAMNSRELPRWDLIFFLKNRQ